MVEKEIADAIGGLSSGLLRTLSTVLRLEATTLKSQIETWRGLSKDYNKVELPELNDLIEECFSHLEKVDEAIEKSHGKSVTEIKNLGEQINKEMSLSGKILEKIAKIHRETFEKFKAQQEEGCWRK